MATANFAYAASADDAAAQPVLAIFGDRPHIRHQLREDALAAGFRVDESGPVASLHAGDARPLAEVVLVDCPAPDGAALARLDVRAHQAGAHLIVATSVAGLEDVFGCLDQAQPQFQHEAFVAARVQVDPVFAGRDHAGVQRFDEWVVHGHDGHSYLLLFEGKKRQRLAVQLMLKGEAEARRPRPSQVRSRCPRPRHLRHVGQRKAAKAVKPAVPPVRHAKPSGWPARHGEVSGHRQCDRRCF